MPFFPSDCAQITPDEAKERKEVAATLAASRADKVRLLALNADERIEGVERAYSACNTRSVAMLAENRLLQRHVCMSRLVES